MYENRCHRISGRIVSISQPHIRPIVRGKAKSENGAKMLSIFSPAGFEDYLARLKTLTDEQFTDEAFMQALNEKYDIWNV